MRKLLLLLPLALGACGTTVDSVAGLGSSHYACPGMPNGVRCESTHSVYEEAISGNLAQENAANALNPVDAKAALATAGRTTVAGDAPGKPCHACGAGTSAIAARSDVGAAPTPKPDEPALIYASDGALPLRTPASVMRIWVNAWQDKDGNLHMPGPIFTEIEPRRWQIGVTDVGAMPGVHMYGDTTAMLPSGGSGPSVSAQPQPPSPAAPPVVSPDGNNGGSSFEAPE